WTKQQVKSRQEFNKKVYSRKPENEKDAILQNESIPPVYVCFLGHSMGGLVAADAALQLEAYSEPSPVIGVLAFDTPYFGLNQSIVTHAAFDRASGYAQKATGAYTTAAAAWGVISAVTAKSNPVEEEKKRVLAASSTPSTGSSSTREKSAVTTTTKSTKTSSSSSGWGWGAIALGVGAAIATTGAAIAMNSHVNKGMEYITSHVQFIGVLLDGARLKDRVSRVLELPISFHCFYTQVKIPPNSSNNFKTSSRTFIELSPIPGDMVAYFSPRSCSGQDEIEAHMEMFNPSKNFDYYPMGEETVRHIKEMVEDALKRKSDPLK
ncbi:hypothetical protein BGW38_001083, partial [Lunasporangiospora selenospora]